MQSLVNSKHSFDQNTQNLHDQVWVDWMWAEEWDCSSPELRLLPQHMYSSLPSLRGAVHHLGKGHSRDLSHIHNVLEFTLLPQSSEFYLWNNFVLVWCFCWILFVVLVVSCAYGWSPHICLKRAVFGCVCGTLWILAQAWCHAHMVFDAHKARCCVAWQQPSWVLACSPEPWVQPRSKSVS